MSKDFSVIVRRTHLQEIEQAVSDLLKRGFEIVYPITPTSKVKSESTEYNYRTNRYKNREVSIYTGYIAKLRRENDGKVKRGFNRF